MRYLSKHHMRLRTIILIILLSLSALPADAQRVIQNMPEHDDKAYYFGITFGVNFSTFRFRYSNSFTDTDTFKTIQSRFGPGFNLGLMGNLRLNKYVDLRFIPSLSFAEKPMSLLMRSSFGTDSNINKSVESIYMHLPLQLKFKSERVGNFRFYALGGGKFDIDLAANARSRRSDEFIKVKPFDLGYEIGVGFEFYYPNFIFSPEIKLSQGLMNAKFDDKKIPIGNAIDQITTRTIVISIHIEG